MPLTRFDHYVLSISDDLADSIIGIHSIDVAKFLGVRHEDYNGRVHYPRAIAKAKVILAKALMAEVDKQMT